MKVNIRNVSKALQGVQIGGEIVYIQPGAELKGAELADETEAKRLARIADKSRAGALLYVTPAGDGDDDEQPNSSFTIKHRGSGHWSVLDGNGEEVITKLTKADAQTFDKMSEEDKAAYVAAHKPS